MKSLQATPLAPDTHYEVKDGELVEDENLQIIGETDPQEFSATSDDGLVAEDMPLRLLNEFVIYNLATQEIVHVGALLELNFAGHLTEYGASGIVEAWADDEDMEPENEEGDASEMTFPSQTVKLSRIVEFNVHHVSHRTNKLDGFAFINCCQLDQPADKLFGLQQDIYSHKICVVHSRRTITHVFSLFFAILDSTPNLPPCCIAFLGRAENDL